MEPLFSIITVTLNASDTIGATARSIAEQSCKLYEWIVQDGGSADDTLDKVEASGVAALSVQSRRDRGIYDGMNRGLARAKGDYVIFLNAGDAFHSPDTLDRIARTVMEYDYPGIVYGQTDVVDSQGCRLGPRHLSAPEVLTLASFRTGMVVCHQAFVVLRKLTGPFNLRYKLSADYDWCIQCLQRSRRNQYIDAVLIDYLNEGMTTRHHRRSLWERFRIMCHYYGTWGTMWRHIGFAIRHLRRKKLDLPE